MADAEELDIWRIIPPEEKLEMMSKAHANGIMACVVAIIIASTMAISLQLRSILWFSLIFCPFVFQFAAGKAWRGLRPRMMLEYLAARSAARRYAFTHNAKDLTLSLIFRGYIEHQFGDDKIQEELEAAIEHNKEAEVWIALFNDAVVLMSERIGGAKLEFGHLINDKMAMTSNAVGTDYKDVKNRELTLSFRDTKGVGTGRCRVTSRYPAALVVFEKKLDGLLKVARNTPDTEQFMIGDKDAEGEPAEF